MLSSSIAVAAIALSLFQPTLATPAPAASVIAPNCNHDNCLRQFIRASAAVEAFCPTFTASSGVALPTFASNCGGSPSRVASACSCLVTPTATATATSTSSASSTATPGLNDLSKAAGKLWFGTAADIPGTAETTDEAYLAVLTNPSNFGEMTPANTMKFFATEPEQNVFNYTGGDYFLDLAESSGKAVRCHNLVWMSQVSDFVTNGNWTKETLTAVMENHIKTLITHWGDRCYSWDVINEALATNGSFSESIWYDVIGPDYFHLAFQFATEAVKETGKDIKLYYNDYGIENPNDKVTALYGLVADLQARNIQIDGVGFESHFEVGGTPSTADQMAAMQGFFDLGLDVVQTELDIRFTAEPYYSAAGQAQQARDYYTSVAACVQAGPKCLGTVVWDFDDYYSWVPSAFAGQGGADIYNNTLERKPAYYAIAEALQNKTCTVC